MDNKYHLIVAQDLESNIGYQNHLIYQIPEDMKYFRELTSRTEDPDKRNAVIMGRKTWQSIPGKFRPLSRRFNIVVSAHHSEDLQTEMEHFDPGRAAWVKSWSAAWNAVAESPSIESVFVIGGASLYQLALQSERVPADPSDWADRYTLDRIYRTQILHSLSTALSQEDKVRIEFDPQTLVKFPVIPGNLTKIRESRILTKDISVLSSGTQVPISYRFQIYQYQSHGYSPQKSVWSDLGLMLDPNPAETQYLQLLRQVLVHGESRISRNATTHAIFGVRMEFDLSDGTIPLLTTKKMAWKTVIKELLWFIGGKTDNASLQSQGVRIWEGNSTRQFLDSVGLRDREVGDLGPIYGFQWRHSGAEYHSCHSDYTGKGVDQLQQCVDLITSNPTSRRIIMTAWNPSDLSQMALPPCHILCQWYVSTEGTLSLQMYQRSGDSFLGIPFNIFSYSVLLTMVAHLVGLRPGRFVHIVGDFHIYQQHLEMVKQQIQRIPYPFPRLVIKRDRAEIGSIDRYQIGDFDLVEYRCSPGIKAVMVA